MAASARPAPPPRLAQRPDGSQPQGPRPNYIAGRLGLINCNRGMRMRSAQTPPTLEISVATLHVRQVQSTGWLLAMPKPEMYDGIARN